MFLLSGDDFNREGNMDLSIILPALDPREWNRVYNSIENSASKIS